MHYRHYHENWKRGTLDFPFKLYHVSSTHPRYEMVLHWHIEFELIRVLEGSFKMSLNEKEVLVTQGSSLLVLPGVLHAGVPEDCVYECIVFDMDILINKNDSTGKLIHTLKNQEMEAYYAFPGTDTRTQLVVDSIFDSIAFRGEGYQTIALGGLYQLVGLIFNKGYIKGDAPSAGNQYRRISQLKTVLSFFDANYHRPISLEEISECVNMSPKYFCRFFKEMTRRTPMDHLNYYRIERACQQLLISDLPITEIAFNCGFNDLSYFIKTFKRYKGTTPKKYLQI
jgi:AraC-like DNA-binding protein